MIESLSRRRFLQISAATFGTGAIGSHAGLSLPLFPQAGAFAESDGPATGNVEKIATYCEMCGWFCGAIAHIRDDRLWKLQGNPLDPGCRGRLCPRGTAGIGAHYDPDRLQSPLIRVGDRGELRWKVATWDEALDHIADKMKVIAEKYGPESIALWNHGSGGRFIHHVLRAYGCINTVMPSYAQCRGARDVGYELTFGDGDRHAGNHGHRQHEVPRADRLSPRREHAQHAGAGVRAGHREQGDDHRGRPASFRGREQGEALAADQARHGHGAAAGLDQRARHGGSLRQGVRRGVRTWLRPVRLLHRRQHP